MTNPRKIEDLIDGEKVRKIIQKQTGAIFGTKGKILEVRVKPVKIYRDCRSFNLSAFYKIKMMDSGGKIRRKIVFAAADSRGGKKRDWQVGQLIFEALAKNPGRILRLPRPYVFLKPRGLFLREHAKGTVFAAAIRKNKGLTRRLARNIAEALREFQNIRIPADKLKEAEKMPNRRDLEKNIRILEKRKHPRLRAVKKEFRKIRAEMAKIHDHGNRRLEVLSHGDFNPFNVVLAPAGKIVFLDAGNARPRHRLLDVAAFHAHLDTLADLKIKKAARIRSQRIFLDAYLDGGKLTRKEKALFALYEKYFRLLASTHVLVWGKKE
jgi:thiamine kinase-like enzyme